MVPFWACGNHFWLLLRPFTNPPPVRCDKMFWAYLVHFLLSHLVKETLGVENKNKNKTKTQVPGPTPKPAKSESLGGGADTVFFFRVPLARVDSHLGRVCVFPHGAPQHLISAKCWNAEQHPRLMILSLPGDPTYTNTCVSGFRPEHIGPCVQSQRLCADYPFLACVALNWSSSLWLWKRGSLKVCLESVDDFLLLLGWRPKSLMWPPT